MMVIVIIHSCCINSFHLVNQFGPPILLQKQSDMTPYTAGLLASLTTVVPTVGAPLTGLYLDRHIGSAILPTVTMMSIFTTVAMYLLLFSKDTPIEPILLAISLSEAIMPTTIMVLIPEYVFREGSALPNAASAVGAAGNDVSNSLIYFQKIFAILSVGDAGVAIVGSSVLGFTLDQVKEQEPGKKHSGGGAALIFVLSVTTTVFAVMLLAAETWTAKRPQQQQQS